MRRGRTEAETCAINGWTVGTVVRGHEEWMNGMGVWSTWVITAIGEASVLAKCIRHERTTGGLVTEVEECSHGEGLKTFACREWTEVAAEVSGEREEVG